MPRSALTTLLAPALIVAATGIPPAHAQSALEAATCGERENLTGKLANRFGEAQTGAGVVSDNRVLEFWQSEKGSWTILMTRPDGTSCIMAAGEHWREKRPAPGDPA